MKLSQLIQQDFYMPGEWDREFNQLIVDSRLVKAGDLFVAVSGNEEHVQTAIKNGAVAVLAQGAMGFRCELSEHHQDMVPVFYNEQTQALFATWLQRRYDIASMSLFAVTGTNGKSSITQYIAQLLTLYNQPCAVIGTLGNGLWPKLESTVNTTPSLAVTLKSLSDCCALGARYGALEVSSHGLVQKRVAGLSFNVAVMSNLSQDHLDYHANMEDYFLAKRSLFVDYQVAFALINIDDEYGVRLAQDAEIKSQIITYGKSAKAQVRYQVQEFGAHGIKALLSSNWGEAELSLPLIGEFNLANATAAIATLASQGFEFKKLCQLAAQLQPVAGRMELYHKADAPTLVVDFAHTPDALRNVLTALKAYNQPIATLFGCGGDRDRSKRPLMLQAAQELSTTVWITDDNPRFEDPEQIFNDMLQGQQDVIAVHDRKTAIANLINSQTANTIILLAGKGHETYQDIQGVKYPYNDGQYLQQLGYQKLGGEHV